MFIAFACNTKLGSTQYNFATELGCGELPTGNPIHQVIKSHDPYFTWSYEITRQTKNISTTTIVPTATKLGRGRMVTYRDWLLPVKSHDTLFTWSQKIMRQSKPIGHSQRKVK